MHQIFINGPKKELQNIMNGIQNKLKIETSTIYLNLGKNRFGVSLNVT